MSTVLPRIKFRDTQIEMAHGAGGKASRRLVEGLFAPLLFGSSTGPLGDSAYVNIDGTQVAITTDSFVVKPLSFPGGSIGELAVNGTVNDLAVSGARAEALVVTFVLEAGLRTEVLEAEVRAMAQAATRAGVTIAGGDTKVVEHGMADRMYITHFGNWAAHSRIDDLSTGGPPGRQGAGQRAHWGSRDHDPARARRTRSRRRALFRHALRTAARRGAGASGRRRHSLDARSDTRRCGNFAERVGPRLRPRHSAVGGSHPGSRYGSRRMRIAGS